MSTPRLRFDVVTLFPEMLTSPLQHSILGRAAEAGLIQVNGVNLREYSQDRHRKVDDAPYGGGVGMVMQPDPFFRAVEALSTEPPAPDHVILLSPRGRRFNQVEAGRLASASRLVLLCGRYEGIDERVHTHLATDILSVGDFVLTGGEIAALAVIDAVARLIPGVLGKDESSDAESFTDSLLEHPQYTRPPDFRGLGVPEVLLSGHHGDVDRWRREQALRRTLRERPDLFLAHELTAEDRKILGLTPPKRHRKR